MKVILNDESFRYDVHSLIKAFYPEEELNYDIISNELRGDIPFIEIGESITVLVPNDLKKDRHNAKNVFKRDMYLKLCDKENHGLSWGTLTGIRPVKLAYGLIAGGMSKEEAKAYLKETYLISDEKVNLLINIAGRQADILKNINIKGSASLYVGIPFCPSICAYCSFSSYPIDKYKNKVSDYLNALKAELTEKKKSNPKKIASVYMGGGTPSTLECNELFELIKFIKNTFNISEDIEFTVECGRPDTITADKLKVLKDLGIQRISINPQSMWDSTLKRIGRNHTCEDIVNAFETARKCGISIINCDLIAGLPGEGEKEIKYTLNKIKELSPENLTVHSLAIKRASRLNYEEHYMNPNSVDDYLFDLFSKNAVKMGMQPYYLYRQKQITGNLENIGFAAHKTECLYNILSMGEFHDIIACGAGAVSKIISDDGKPKRIPNPKDVTTYMNSYLL